MISIIICSRKPQIDAYLNENISKTIGTIFEFVIIDNSRNKYSIFEAYNEGVKKARYEYLCFIHDDILFKSKEWGKHVIDYLNCENVGLLGAIGGHIIFDDIISSWWHSGYVSGIVYSAIWHNRKPFILSKEGSSKYLANNNYAKVAAVDGLFMCLKKETFNTIQFDSSTFKGWHMYDLDTCMQIHNIGQEVIVSNKIIIEHFSTGNCNNDWFNSIKIFYKKWNQQLPVIEGIELLDDEYQKLKASFLQGYNLYNKLRSPKYFQLFYSPILKFIKGFNILKNNILFLFQRKV